MSNFDVSGQAFGELSIRQVVTPNGGELGWAVCVLLDSPFSSTEDEQKGTNPQRAELLVLRHCSSKDQAFSVKQGFLNFLREEHEMVAKLACPQVFWEWNALPQLDSADISWIVLQGEELTTFRAGHDPLRCDKENWHPDQQASLAHSLKQIK